MKQQETGIIEAVRYAIQMELDGKKFYSLSAKQSQGRVGKELFEWLTEQEDLHRKRFEQIYEAIVQKKGWPVIQVKDDKRQTFRTLFSDALRDAGINAVQQASDLGAADKAIVLEIKSRDFYKDRSAKAASDVERNFFTAISAEEQGHYIALVDFKEYMTDPIGFFTRTEHHSVDGQ
jgi:rubrerythrin